METGNKKVQLRGHNFESDVIVRHRTTIGRFDASVAAYPNLVGEGITEAAALDDLATMLSSDPEAYAEVEAKIKETQTQKDADAAKAKTDNEADAKAGGGHKKEVPPASGEGAPAGAGAAVTKPGAPGAGIPTGAGTVPGPVTHTGDTKDTLVHTEGATITKS